MNPWFRAYESALDDPKVQRLPGELFKSWFNLLCLACRHDGALPPPADIAFALRKSDAAVRDILDRLIEAGLVDETEKGLAPHNWNGRQYKSDVSTDRVKQHRERQRNVSPAVSETPSESEADTEQNRTEKERATRSGSRLPDDWQPSAEDRAFAGDFDIDVDSVASVFRDYWHAVAGAKGRKTDWPATWRNWVRREAEGKKTRATRPALNGHTASSTFVDDGSQWSARLRGWQQSKFWKPYDWGPEPGVYGCLVPPALLEKVA